MYHGKRILAALLLALVALTACSKPQASKQQTTIRIAGFEQDPLMKALTQAYQDKHPDVQFQNVSLGKGGFAELKTAMNEGKADLLPGYAAVDLAKQNLLQPFDRFVQMDKLDLTPLGRLEDLQYNGRLYELPYVLAPFVLMYNRDLIQQASVKFPDQPITWEEFRNLAKKLTSGDGNEKIWGFHDPVIAYSLEVFIRSNTTRADWWFDYDAIGKGYQTFADMIWQDRSSPQAPPLDEYGRPQMSPEVGFDAGKAALTIRSLYSLGQLGSEPLHVGATFLPAPAGRGAVGLARPQSIAMVASSENQDAAWSFVKFLLSPEGANIIASHGVMPAYRTPDIAEIWLRSRPGTPDALKALATMELKLVRDSDPTVPNAANEWIRICALDAFMGKRSWQDAFAQYQAKVPANSK